MKTFINGEEREQLSLLPRSVDEYVPNDDIVRYLDKLVEEIGLKGIESCYSSLGRRAYSPRLLVKIIMYGKIRGIRSGRELSSACKENLKFIYLARNESPDFRTINEFRRKHSAELAGLLRQTIEIGIEQGFIDLEQICIDGTKLSASAGRRSFKTIESLRKELDLLERDLQVSFEEDSKRDKEEDDKYGKDCDGERRLPPELKDKQQLAAKIRSAIKEHEKSEKTIRPKTISTTDPECRMMKGKGVNPSYNAQAAIDVKSRMAVGGYVVNACCDSSELIPVIDSVESNTGKTPKLVSADKGYTKLKQLAELSRRNIDGYISQRQRRKQEFVFDEQSNCYICPENKKLVLVEKQPSLRRYAISACGKCVRKPNCWRKGASRRSICVTDTEEVARQMQLKVHSERGKEISRIRASTIEPLFGTIKFAKRLRQVTVRGLKRVSEIWQLELAAYNIQKLFNLRAITA